MRFYSILLLFAFCLFSTEKVKSEVLGDSTRITHIRERADRLLDEVFRPEPALNNPDSIIREMDKLPSFGIYKDNYFVAGTEILKTPAKDNSDAKFQVSIRQILTNSVLPFRTYLFLTYTQLAFWDVFKESFPFRDLNFNPTIGVGRYLVRNNRYVGGIMLQFEHESNGKDGENSRSWNKVSFSTNLIISRSWGVQAKMWIPIVDGENNRDIVKYKGWAFLASNYRYRNFYFGAVLTKRGGVNFNHNFMLTMAYKPLKTSNQHFFIEYYNGYGENLLEYREHRHRLRAGFIIKSPFTSMF